MIRFVTRIGTGWPRRRARLLLAVALGLALAAGAGLWVMRPDLVPFGPRGGAFALTDTEGRAVTQADLLGRPTLLYFGYTHCPDICPTTLFELSAVMAALGPAADRLNVVFVTVDPARDTPAVMKAYLSAFDRRIRGFTGTPDAVADLMRADRVHAAIVPYTADAYTIDHSTAVLVFDAEGHDRGTLDLDDAPAEIADGLRPLIGSAPKTS